MVAVTCVLTHTKKGGHSKRAERHAHYRGCKVYEPVGKEGCETQEEKVVEKEGAPLVNLRDEHSEVTNTHTRTHTFTHTARTSAAKYSRR